MCKVKTSPLHEFKRSLHKNKKMTDEESSARQNEREKYEKTLNCVSTEIGLPTKLRN